MAKKIKLTNQDDDYTGSKQNEIINARGGDDNVSGGKGNDTLNGGAGNDVLKGGADDDKVNGGTGDDNLFGGSGDDTLNGGAGTNTVDGGSGDDTVILDGNYADAKITAVGAGFKIVTAAGTTTVSNVELFQFADGTKAAGDLIPDLTLELTADIDTILGTAADETISGVPLSELGTFDDVDGGDGKDKMSLISTSALAEVLTTLATVKNVESLVVADAGGSFTADVSSWTGLTSVEIAQGADVAATKEDVAVTTKNNVTSVSLTLGGSVPGGGDTIAVADAGTTTDALASVSITGYTDYKATITSDALTSLSLKGANDLDVEIVNGKAHALALTVDGSGSSKLGGNSVQDDTASTVAITALTTTDATEQSLLLEVKAATGVTVGGAGAITVLDGSDLSKVATFDASANTGGVDLLEELGTAAIFTGGKGNDTLAISSMFTGTGAASGGDGTDTLQMDVFDAAALTVDGKFAAKIDGFESLSVDDVPALSSATINIANLDNVSTVTSGGTAPDTGDTEVQTYTITNGGDSNGGQLVFGGVAINIIPNATAAQVANAILAAEADIIAANPDIDFIEVNGTDVVVTYEQFSGPQALLSHPDDGMGLNSTLSTQTAGTNETVDVDTITVGQTADVSGQFTVNVGATAVNVTALVGQTQTQIAASIAAAVNAAFPGGGVAATSAGGVVTLTGASGTGAIATSIAANATVIFGAGDEPVAAEGAQNYIAPGAETQTIQFNANADADGGSIIVGGVRVDIAAGATIDQMGLAVAAQENAIKTANSNIASVSYDTGTDKVSIVYKASAGDVPLISLSDNAVSGVAITDTVTVPGTVGTPGGELILNNFVNGGTFVLTDENGGYTEINVKDAAITGADSVNVILKGADGIESDGWLQIDDVTTLNFKTVDADKIADTQNHDLFVGAFGTTTVTVEGSTGINFGDWGSDFNQVTSFDASKVTGTGAVGEVYVTLGNSNGVTATGGAGDDTIWSNSAALKVDKLSGGAGDDRLGSWAGNDVLDGGAGDDQLYGNAGADTLTGGAGVDEFWFDELDSVGTTLDTITDFIANTDKIDLTNVSFGLSGVNYGEEVTSLAAANSALTGAVFIVFDTVAKQLYVDVDGSGDVNANDLVINMTGVTNLSASDFV
jgi:Ca2+-binding RTX toxin-like protein